jgi:sugar lactone lactonase YvrE
MSLKFLSASMIMAGAVLFAHGCAHKNDTKPADPATHAAMDTARLTKLAEFKGVQVTGVTISDEGRLFANFPRWRKDLPFSVVEVMSDGTYKPYPDQDWNSWKGLGLPKKNQFNTVQSVVAHGSSLFVLDPSSPFMKGVVGKAKLYEFDLATNTLKKTYEFTDVVAPRASYLNDLRVDDKNNAIYITDSGMGAIVVLDRVSGKSRRLLGQDKSTKSEDVKLTVEGKLFTVQGKPPKIHSDGIALSPESDWLYYHALSANTLYRVPAAALIDTKMKAADLSKKVEKLGMTPAPDGMIFDQAGNLYMGDLQSNSIVYRTPEGEMKTLVQDPQIKWADTFTIGKSPELIFTASRLHEAPAGSPADDFVFTIYRTPLATATAFR